MTTARCSKCMHAALLAIAGVLGSGTTQAAGLAYLGLTDGYWEAWVADDDGTRARQLTRFGADISRLSWYPDGQRLFVNRHDGRWFEVGLADGTAKEIAAPLPGIVDGVLDPSGESVTFSLSTGSSIDDNDIWLHELATQRSRKLTQMARLQHEPVWSPDGRFVYFLSGDGGQAHDIWRVDTSSAGTEQLTVNDLYHFDLAIRSDGTLAYSSNRSGNYEIWIQAPNGRPRQLTFDPGLDARPAWDADGETLIFESTRGGDVALYRVEVDGGNVSPVLADDRAARLPTPFRTQEDDR